MYFNPYSSLNTFNNARNLMTLNRVLDIPRANNIASAITPTVKKFSWGTFFNGASKTISTINQALPLYNQVKPIFNNAKNVLSMVKNLKNINKPTPTTEELEEPVEEITPSPIQNEKDIIDVPSIIIEERIETSPAKPFFN